MNLKSLRDADGDFASIGASLNAIGNFARAEGLTPQQIVDMFDIGIFALTKVGGYSQEDAIRTGDDSASLAAKRSLVDVNVSVFRPLVGSSTTRIEAVRFHAPPQRAEPPLLSLTLPMALQPAEQRILRDLLTNALERSLSSNDPVPAEKVSTSGEGWPSHCVVVTGESCPRQIFSIKNATALSTLHFLRKLIDTIDLEKLANKQGETFAHDFAGIMGAVPFGAVMSYPKKSE
ncbi:hypothetical protein GJ700_12535 [Duganella sp. FT92W]|uniref:Uncharacterized protein n=1 Tax=Pseudoduganella rivuli TaxID=2666085 RepID=A0A7X2IM41_9BURK|nr:hypothetical protein [Pseudoduganella rivuli]MRV72537.1 hypothetical protein [Pseudoduganella rivuli]